MPRKKTIDTETPAAAISDEKALSLIADLVEYAKRKLYLNKYDAVYAENQLLAEFGFSAPLAEKGGEPGELQKDILDPLIKYAEERGLTTPEDALLYETKLMGYVTPAPGEVITAFDDIASAKGPEAATAYLYDISVNSNYIRMTDIRKNLKWNAKLPSGDLTITINLAKPEKSNADVARAKAMPQTGYPKCMLCLENLGYHGNPRHPARETIRIVPMYLNDEPWFMQFSPYVYFDEHCIAVSESHHPMAITDATFVRLTDFTDMFPHYFLGSNADLPIVGGSILAHEHYQGGKKVLPMFSRPVREHYAVADSPDVSVDILDWYNSVIRLSSVSRASILRMASRILEIWRSYSDESVGVLAHTDAPHNTITPIACKENGRYVLYLILRNNRTDEKHPYGIFHPTEDMHNIKKEGIGLIEAMGTFILPGRLQSECIKIREILSGGAAPDFKALSDPEHPLSKHFDMIVQLVSEYGTSLSQKEADKAIVERINSTCVKILECTAVFKSDDAGREAFARFMNRIGAEKV